MSEIWNDILLRDYINDKGEYPTSGTLSNSPDIIPSGILPIENPQKYFITDNWDNGSLSKGLVARMDNYIYMRASNLAGKKQTGKLYLYYSKASLLLFPSLWKDNIITTGDGKDYFEFEVDKDGKLVSFDNKQGTFFWRPEEISGDHYCLVGRVETKEHPNEVPRAEDIEDFAYFISTHPGYAWHNVDVVSKDSPNYSSKPVSYNQGRKGGEVHFELICKNFPVNSQVMLTCTTPGTTPSINIEKHKIVNTVKDVFGIVVTIPANWEGVLYYHYWFPEGIKPTGDPEIEISPILIVAKGHPRLSKFAKQITSQAINKVDNIGPVEGIVVGSHKTIAK